MKTEKQVEEKGLQLEDLKVSNLPELQGWKEKQEKLVEENPYVEIIDNKSYEIACKSRTALLKGRTELEKQDKLIASKVASFRKEVKTETDILIAITLPSEEKQQEEVKRYEGIKAAAKAEEERLEALRISTINKKIDETETSCLQIIQQMTFGEIEFCKTQLFAFFTIDFDFEEYDILFEQVKSRVELALEQKVNSLTESENQRLENIRLEKENAEAKRISDLQASRLTEILPYVAFGDMVDLTNLSGLEESVYSEILEVKKALFEADAKYKKETQDKLDAENLERENKSKADKEKIFEIRKNRILEIYPNLDFSKEFVFYGKTDRDILNADTIDFETIITDAKLAIEEAKLDAKEAEKQKEKDLELSKSDAIKLKSENKARVKRLSGEKKIYKQVLIDNLNSFPLFFDSKENEIKEFSIEASNRVVDLLNELLTKLNNL